MSNTNNLPVAEHFYSFQGEGVWTGNAAYFLRLYGCDQKCSFCDSAATWHPNWKPAAVPLLPPEEVAALVEAPAGAFVVITGGEPTLYNLDPLIALLHRRKYPVHIETAGHHPLPKAVDWVTLSPKLFAKPPLPGVWERADEIKLICETPEQALRDIDTVLQHVGGYAPPPIWLHPEWSQRENAELLSTLVEMVKGDPRLRCGFQIHKLYAADYLDPHADRRVIPLGGVNVVEPSTPK